MDFLKRLKARRAEKHATVIEKYAALIRRAANGGELSEADTARLDALAAELKFEPERIEADVETIKRVVALEEIAPTLDAKKVEHKALTVELGAAHDELKTILARFNERITSIEGRKGQAGVAMTEASQAVDELADLRSRHWRLLGFPEPPKREVPETIIDPISDGHRIYQDSYAEVYGGESKTPKPLPEVMAPLPGPPARVHVTASAEETGVKGRIRGTISVQPA